MTNTQLAAALKKAISDSGMKPSAIAELAGCSEAGIRATVAGHVPLTHRADALLRALGRSLVLGDPAGPPIEIQAPSRRSRK